MVRFATMHHEKIQCVYIYKSALSHPMRKTKTDEEKKNE